jgi:hypothetical protein
MEKTKNRYYFYGHAATPNWYTFSTDTLRKAIKRHNTFTVLYVFTGVCTEASRKEDAEENFRDGENLIQCKEPACVLKARREYFDEWRKGLVL